MLSVCYNNIRVSPKLVQWKLKNVTVELHIDQSVNPVALKQRRTPFHLREKVEDEIEHLLKQDLIEKVDGVPTLWVSPIVVTQKNNIMAEREKK